jgi:hypothetical protein
MNMELYREDINEFSSKRGVDILDADLVAIQRPIDIAKLKGWDKEKNIVDIGKEYLLENGGWMGVCDLSIDSQNTRDFVDYLYERKRNDLVQKYFSEYYPRKTRK